MAEVELPRVHAELEIARGRVEAARRRAKQLAALKSPLPGLGLELELGGVRAGPGAAGQADGLKGDLQLVGEAARETATAAERDCRQRGQRKVAEAQELRGELEVAHERARQVERGAEEARRAAEAAVEQERAAHAATARDCRRAHEAAAAVRQRCETELREVAAQVHALEATVAGLGASTDLFQTEARGMNALLAARDSEAAWNDCFAMIEADNESLREAACELVAQLGARDTALDASEAELRQVGLALDGVLAQVCILISMCVRVRACVIACVRACVRLRACVCVCACSPMAW